MPEPSGLKLKLDDDGHVVLRDGQPVYSDGDREIAFDFARAKATIKELSEERDEHLGEIERLKRENRDVTKRYKKLEDRGGPEAAIKALDTIAGLEAEDLDAKELAGRVEAQEAEIHTLREQLKTKEEETATLQRDFEFKTVSDHFGSSPIVREQLVPMPVAFWMRNFKDHFKLENGKLVAYYQSGRKVYSSNANTASEPADFDDALRLIIEQDYPSEKDKFFRESGAAGSATGGESGLPRGAHGVRTRKDLKTLAQKTEFIDKEGAEAYAALPAE